MRDHVAELKGDFPPWFIATGVALDNIAKDFKLERRTAESDASLRNRIWLADGAERITTAIMSYLHWDRRRPER